MLHFTGLGILCGDGPLVVLHRLCYLLQDHGLLGANPVILLLHLGDHILQ